MPPDNSYQSAYSGTDRFIQPDIRTDNAIGFSASTYDDLERGIDLNRELIRNKPATFFMRVNSDVMRESGIYKEDVVVVDRSVEAATGKVIIAILNGEMLIRRFEKNNNKIRLLADPGKLAPINIDASCAAFAVWGVVTYVIHKP